MFQGIKRKASKATVNPNTLRKGKNCKKNKIINPVTGRCVKKTGTIGKRLLLNGEIHTDLKRYRNVRKLWDWWSLHGNNVVRQEMVKLKCWDPRLNDPQKGNYLFYIMSYEKLLKKTYQIYLKKLKKNNCRYK